MPTHRHNVAFTVLAGGASGFFKTGCYPELHDNRADISFGTTSATSSSGERLDLTGPLLELHR